MHVSRINFLTTLSGFIHWRLTGQRVLGIGDASGMFPVDYEKQNYRMDLMELFHQRTRHLGHSIDLHALLPQILLAGQPAGVLTPARRADVGSLRPPSTRHPAVSTGGGCRYRNGFYKLGRAPHG